LFNEEDRKIMSFINRFEKPSSNTRMYCDNESMYREIITLLKKDAKLETLEEVKKIELKRRLKYY
jgi:heat shock protein HslJ